MSVLKHLLNWYFRTFERPFLENAAGPAEVRHNLNQKARFLFHGPFGVTVADIVLGGRPALHVAPDRDGPSILYFHGGAYVFGNPKTHVAMISTLTKKADAQGYLLDYSKAPENPFPAAIEDAEAAWLDLIGAGKDPQTCFLGGDSAGGGLALALLAVLIEKGHPLPAGVFAYSPLTDMTFSGPSIQENAQKDVILPAHRVEDMADLYLGDTPRGDPRASPLFADFKGAPPVYLMVGDTEILRDDSLRLRDHLEAQNVDVTLDVEHDVPHVWQILHNMLPEARRSLDKTAAWIKQQMQVTSES